MTPDDVFQARLDRIDATFADESLRLEAYAVIAREGSKHVEKVASRATDRPDLADESCTTCVDCCYPQVADDPDPANP